MVLLARKNIICELIFCIDLQKGRYCYLRLFLQLRWNNMHFEDYKWKRRGRYSCVVLNHWISTLKDFQGKNLSKSTLTLIGSATEILFRGA